jgi:hypothetical protein
METCAHSEQFTGDILGLSIMLDQLGEQGIRKSLGHSAKPGFVRHKFSRFISYFQLCHPTVHKDIMAQRSYMTYQLLKIYLIVSKCRNRVSCF